MIPVIALGLVACANETPSDAIPPPASFDPAPPGEPTPPDELFDQECAEPLGASTEETVDGCLPPDDFEEADQLAPGTVQLTVSNQSIEDPTVHLVIRIDDKVVADEDFEVGTQHNWVTFEVDSLSPGEHTITVESDTEDSMEQTFTIPDGEGRYLLLDYWSESTVGGFNFEELDMPFQSA